MKSFQYGFMAVGLLFLFAPLRGDDRFPGAPSRAYDIDQKLKSIVVSVDFTNASIEEATGALTLMSKQLDPAHEGVGFVIQPEASASGQPITLKLDKVPLGATLRYVCLLSGVRYKVDDYLISIAPSSWTGQDLVRRTFHVDPDFVRVLSNQGVIPSATTP